MKLLLDEMYWPALADQLVAPGHDVIAAKTDASLTGLSDEDLFAAAQVAERTVVTENVGDLIPIVQAHAGAAMPHHGLVLVSSHALPAAVVEPAPLGGIVRQHGAHHLG